MELKFTRRQWLTLIVIGLADFCNAICVSLQAPFFPKEAEEKGATATEYGLVFGIFELVVFAVSPIYGQYINYIGPKVLFNGGIFTTAISAILFGLLDKLPGHTEFISLAFVIRIVEAMGNAGFLTASFAIIAKEFPNNVATTFASLETFFGLGLIVGPMVGGALYSLGGYYLPFTVLGSALMVTAMLTYCVLPKHEADRIPTPGETKRSMFALLRIPGVAVSACAICSTSSSIGFISATLEPHLRQFNLGPIVLGIVFVINGGVYALTAPLWGWLCDKVMMPKIAAFLGCLLIVGGFCIVGPAPYIPLESSLTSTIAGLVLHGFGIAAILVSSFTDALKTAIRSGFPDTIDTYGLASGMWTSTFAFGAFVGPSVSGYLFDKVGFSASVIFVIVVQAVVALVILIFIIIERRYRRGYKNLDIKDTIVHVDESYMSDSSDFSRISHFDIACKKSRSRLALFYEANNINAADCKTINQFMISKEYNRGKTPQWTRLSDTCSLQPNFSQTYGALDRRSNHQETIA